jgi:hypothetical protein
MDDGVTLYRRVLLIRPDLTLSIPAAPNDTVDGYFRLNDISARPLGAGLMANSLSDLTLRENRYAHNVGAFPYELQRASLANTTFALDRRVPTGEDILLTNVSGFDIRVYSPNAPLKTPNDSQFLGPSDPNYVTNGSAEVFEGSYVDLGWDLSGTSSSWFALPNSSPPALPPQPFSAGNTWCSWSPHYEYNGIDDDGDGFTDEGTDGRIGQ